MAMSFEQPDFDAIKEEREAAAGKNKKEEKVLTEDDCWEYQYVMQKFNAAENDTGYRQIFKNSLTGRYRMKKKVGEDIRHPRRINTRVSCWDWDGEAYELN